MMVDFPDPVAPTMARLSPCFKEKEIPFKEIQNADIIGISSGASAPEKLVQALLNNIKKDRKVSIEEVVVAEEKVVFKLPKELN